VDDGDRRAPAVRAAFIGSGFMGRMHARAAAANGAELVAVLSRDPERADRAAAELGAARGRTSLEQLLAEDRPDVVHICSPNATHHDYARAVIEAGVNVVCEKPLATSPADAQDLADLADERDVVASVPFVYRFHPMVREARARIAAGELGRVIGLQGAYLQDWLLLPDDDDWRVDSRVGGPSRAFGDIGSHLVDLLEFVTGERIARLVATTATVHARRGGRSVDTEDVAAVLVELAGGAVGTIQVSQVFAGHKNDLVLDVAGELASLRFEQERPDTLLLGGRDASAVLSRDARVLAADAARLSTVPSGHPMGYADAFTGYVGDVYAAIRGERPEGLPTFRDGARAAEATAAVLRSAAGRSWTDLPTRGIDDDRDDATRHALHRAVG